MSEKSSSSWRGVVVMESGSDMKGAAANSSSKFSSIVPSDTGDSK